MEREKNAFARNHRELKLLFFFRNAHFFGSRARSCAESRPGPPFSSAGWLHQLHANVKFERARDFPTCTSCCRFVVRLDARVKWFYVFRLRHKFVEEFYEENCKLFKWCFDT